MGIYGQSSPFYLELLVLKFTPFAVIYIGRLGLLAILSFLFLCFIVIELGWTPEKMALWFQSLKKTETQKTNEEIADEGIEIDLDSVSEAPTSTENLEEEITFDNSADKKETAVLDTEPIAMEIEAPVEESVEEKLSKTLVEKQGFFDPTLELSNFKRPGIDLLKDYGDSGITINQEELEANKNKIVDTLNNYKIGIANIKATIGPTVTLYEIVPDAGIRISKIKNLEDDIALSLSALGIRIIAPIPGKGTIGIEVPNQKPSIVSMRSVISASKFQNAEMELPIALGKTISNETFVVDLAKMPHLLMAGATGQGKSVGLNAVLTSLLYKKHPAEVKFVLVDPKKGRTQYLQ